MISHQCPLCSWLGDARDQDDPALCPRCGHGLIERRFSITD